MDAGRQFTTFFVFAQPRQNDDKEGEIIRRCSKAEYAERQAEHRRVSRLRAYIAKEDEVRQQQQEEVSEYGAELGAADRVAVEPRQDKPEQDRAEHRNHPAEFSGDNCDIGEWDIDAEGNGAQDGIEW